MGKKCGEGIQGRNAGKEEKEGMQKAKKDKRK